VDSSRSLGTHLGEVCPSSPHPGHFEDRPLSPHWAASSRRAARRRRSSRCSGWVRM
jgi:hypothetical protein